MRKTFLSALALAILFTSATAQAQEQKPIVVLSLGGYQRIIDDIGFLGRLSDTPDLAQSIESSINFLTQNQGLAGLDKSRPWGVSLTTNGAAFQALAFIPVTDVKKLLDALSGLTGDADAVDGVYKLQAQGLPVPLFVKEANGYAFISQDAASLASPPADPLKLLGGLDKQYDVAIRVNVQNVPEVFRQMAIDQFKLGMESGLHQGPDESDQAFDQRTKMTHAQMEAMVRAINDLSDITVGFSIDEPGRKAVLDLAVTATEGTKTAQQMAAQSVPPSKFSGFRMSDAVVTLHASSKADPESTQQSLAMLNSMRSQVLTQIEQEEDLGSPQIRAAFKDIASQVLDVVQDTVKQGTFNGGAVVVGSGPFTLAGGGIVADSTKLDGAIRKLAELAKTERSIPADALKLDAETHKGVVFHKLTMDIPDDDDHADDVKKLIGEKAIFTFGLGKESVFFAVGEQGVDTIKKVIDKSEGSAEPTTNPVELAVKLAPILKFASETDNANPMVASLAAALKESGKDKLSFVVKPIKNGSINHIEAEEGILKVLGSLAKLAAAQGGVGAF